ncbi:hypothetical protein ACFO1B_50765 [Dactylosporangium siamense]|uniref:Uncharacterized protein n=1 Tax=Dactylosporangium siamense TaxID=685454 RepID=A0A919PXW6_9ACTN|nr:hypothetical protein [Dactylosporangium siamense]GIG52357.1 hypothetical protein Dsi01nite_103980 [Dactylosporangium siamense]
MDHDLHSLLAAARDDAPPPRLSIDDITAAGRRLARRRRRTTLLASVAGGVAAVITGATAAVVLISPPTLAPTVDPNGNPGLADVSQSPARRADFTPAGAFETNYTGYTSGRFVVRDPDLVTAGYQQSTIDVSDPRPSTSPTGRPAVPTGTAAAPGGSAPATAPGVKQSSAASGRAAPREGRLVVYNVDAFDPTQFTGGEKLQVAGKTALLRYAGSLAPPSATGKDGCCVTPAVPTIAWQYLPGAWAAIYWSSFETAPTRDELIALAEDLPAGEVRAFPVGVRLRNTPKNYRMIAVGTRKFSYDTTNLSVVWLSPKTLVPPFTMPVDLEEHPSIVLTLGVADPRTRDKIGASSCQQGSGTCSALLGDGQFYVQVDTFGQQAIPSTELAQILKSMTAEQPDDPTNWPPATDTFAS